MRQQIGWRKGLIYRWGGFTCGSGVTDPVRSMTSEVPTAVFSGSSCNGFRLRDCASNNPFFWMFFPDRGSANQGCNHSRELRSAVVAVSAIISSEEWMLFDTRNFRDDLPISHSFSRRIYPTSRHLLRATRLLVLRPRPDSKR